MLSLSFFSYWIYQSIFFVPHDFVNSYFSAYFTLKGEFDVAIFDPYTFNKKIFDQGFHNIFASYNPNPPFTALFFTPFALLPLWISKLSFNLITCVLFLISTYRLCKCLSVPLGPILIIIPIVFLIPIRNQILFGQTYFLIFFLLTEGYLAYADDKKIKAACFWSVAILIKVFPLIIIIFIVFRKDWKCFISLASICGLLLISSVLLQGVDVWRVYILDVLPRNNRGEISSSFMANYQSAHMFLKYAFIHNKDLNNNPIVDSPLLFTVFEIIYKSLLSGVSALLIYKRKDILSFGVLILCGIMISPYGSTYGNILLLILLIASWKFFTQKYFIAIAVLVFFIANFPLSILNELPKLLQFPRLIFYIILFLMICYLSRVKFQLNFVLAFMVLFSFSLLQKKHDLDPSNSLFQEQKRNLIFNYGTKNNYLFYNYWTDAGPNFYVSEMRVHSLTFNDIHLRNNQIIFKNKQVTYTTDNKIKPALLDGKAIIYLSDKDRGIGFYNLRIINL